MEWIAKQPDAQECPQLQFLLHGRSQRIASTKQVNVSIRNTGINRDNLPTKEQLLNDPEKRQDLASNILSMSSEIKDSNAFWRRESQRWIGGLRYLADPPEYRERIPIMSTLFQTRAMPYNQCPAAHVLYRNAEEIKNNKSSEDYFKLRLQNVLQNPIII